MRSLFFIKSPNRELGKSFVRKRRYGSCVRAWLRLDFKVKTNVRFEQLCLWEKKGGGGGTFASETEAKSVFFQSQRSALPSSPNVCILVIPTRSSSIRHRHCQLQPRSVALAQQVNINFYPTQVRSFGYPCQAVSH